MRTLRLSLVGTVILMLLGGLGSAVMAQADGEAGPFTPVTGTRLSFTTDTSEEEWSVEGAVGHARDFKFLETVEWSDPRLPSDVLNVLNFDMHVIGQFQDLPLTGAVLLQGSDGYWTGSLTGFCDQQETCHVMETLTGHGAYEGLFATILGGDAEAGAQYMYEGMIFEGEMPPMPEALEPTVVAAQEAEQAGGSENAIAATSVWTSKGAEDEPLTRVNSVNLAPDGNLWVLDGPQGQVQILSPDGEVIEAWGSPGTGEGEFGFVRPDGLSYGDVAFAPDGSFYVVESGNQRVQRFGPQRDFVTMWGSKGEADGQFLDPIGAAVAPDGNVYVADDKRDDVQVFDPDGAFLFAFGGEGSGPGQIGDAGFLDIAADGTVYAADFNAHRVIKYAADGGFLAEWGSAGDGPYGFNNPQGIAVGPDGLVYLADFRNGKVKVFDGDGQHLATWPDPTDESPTWSMPNLVGIDVDGNGNVYVSEYFTALVRKLATEPATE